MSHVSANDLYLSILTDGRMYDQCVTAARLTAPKARAAAFERIIKTGWEHYKRDVGPSIIRSADMNEAARLLESDRVQHVAELDAAPKLNQTHRTQCGRGRVTYHPEWDRSNPWVSYIGGTAGRHFANLDEAAQYFAGRGLKLNTGA